MRRQQSKPSSTLEQEVFDIARAKSALSVASTSSPLEVDALRRDNGKGKDEEKGKGKGKGNDTGKKKGKDSQVTDASVSKTEKPKCFHFGKLRHRKPECGKLVANTAKSTSEGKPHNIGELGATGTVQTQASASQVSSLTVSERDPEEHVYIWMLAQPSAHIQGLMLLDSGAFVCACPPSFVGNNENLFFLWFETAQCEWCRSLAQPAPGNVWGIKRMTLALKWLQYVVIEIPSLSWLEDADWTFESTGAGRKLRRGQEEIEVLRCDGVCWIGVDDAGDAETALRLCTFSAEVAEDPADLPS